MQVARWVNIFSAVLFVLLGACGEPANPNGGTPIDTSFTVGPEGDTLSFLNGLVVLVFPPGAVTTPTTFSVTSTSTHPGGPTVVTDAVVDVGPNGTTFAVPVQLMIHYLPSALPAGVREEELGLYKVVNNLWQLNPTSTVDAADNVLEADIQSLSVYGVLGAPVATVSIDPPSATLLVGDSRQFTAIMQDADGDTLPARTATWSSSDEDVATVDEDGLVTSKSDGPVEISATSEGQSAMAGLTVSTLNVDEPFYDPSNPDYVLHVYEDWSGHTSINDIGTALRSDGGPPWGSNGIQPYGAVVNSGDPFGSVRYITTEYTSDPPIAPHGTGPHSTAFHWYGAGTYPDGARDAQGDDNAVGYTGSPTGATSTTLTDNAQNWPTNYWAGRNVDITAGPGSPANFVTITSNTATTLTVAGWDNGTPTTGSTYQIRAGSYNNRGVALPSTAYLNKPAKDVVVYEWAARERGTNWFEGKLVDINAGLNTDVGRFAWEPYDAKLGWDNDGNDPLASAYYSNAGQTPRFAGLPPRYSYVAPNINRDYISALPPVIGHATAYYKQNVGWGTGAGEFSWGGGGTMQQSNGAYNADLQGTNTPLWQAGWLYYKLQITREPSGGTFGQGRIEMWIGQTPGSLLKVMDYLGDVSGHPAEGLVYVDPNGNSDMLPGQVVVYGLASRRYTGGSVIDIGTIRIWSHSR